MNEAILKPILAQLRARKVLLLGDVILDEYLWGEVKRISPEAPVPIVEIRSRTYVAGGAANAAANIVSLGGQALLAGAIGPDPAGSTLIALLREHGVDPAGLQTEPQRVTTTKTRLIAASQQVVRMDHEHIAHLHPPTEESLLHWAESQLPSVESCILSDYGKGVVSNHLAERFIALARRFGKPVVVDPKGTHYLKYRGASIIKPNIHEVERFLKIDLTDEATLLAAGRRLVEFLEGCAVLITRGSDGMSLFRADAEPVHIATRARKVFDVTGAGDTVVSVLALCQAAAVPLEQAIELANLAAGVVVGKRGTATVTAEELFE